MDDKEDRSLKRRRRVSKLNVLLFCKRYSAAAAAYDDDHVDTWTSRKIRYLFPDLEPLSISASLSCGGFKKIPLLQCQTTPPSPTTTIQQDKQKRRTKQQSDKMIKCCRRVSPCQIRIVKMGDSNAFIMHVSGFGSIL